MHKLRIYNFLNIYEESVCSCERKIKVEKAPRCYFKKNRRLYTQLLETLRLLFGYCLLSSATISVRSRLHIRKIATDVVVCIVKNTPFYFWFGIGTTPVKILPNEF